MQNLRLDRLLQIHTHTHSYPIPIVQPAQSGCNLAPLANLLISLAQSVHKHSSHNITTTAYSGETGQQSPPIRVGTFFVRTSSLPSRLCEHGGPTPSTLPPPHTTDNHVLQRRLGSVEIDLPPGVRPGKHHSTAGTHTHTHTTPSAHFARTHPHMHPQV